jgi:hypothetical protein
MFAFDVVETGPLGWACDSNTGRARVMAVLPWRKE